MKNVQIIDGFDREDFCGVSRVASGSVATSDVH